ncbi:MAG: hypothetical protein JKX97_02535 [Candidatus Lindowbacteria bacterium]|nr:hypothetical protein [Candidatus Lindowbacteria bacterium]
MYRVEETLWGKFLSYAIVIALMLPATPLPAWADDDPVVKSVKVVKSKKGKENRVDVTIAGSESGDFYRTSNYKNLKGARWRETKGRKNVRVGHYTTKGTGKKTIYV